MPTKEQVLEALKKVMDPEINRSIVELNMVKDIAIQGSTVRVEVLLTIRGCPLRTKIENDVTATIKSLPGVENVEVILGAMTDEQRAALTQQLRGGRPRTSPLLERTSRTKIICVASGKGGVGKSTTTANLAVAMGQLGYNVGLIDADIYGFSIPRMLGLRGQPVVLDEQTIMPMEAHGIKAISMGSLVSEDTPVIWRGPMLGKILDQFLGDVHWGDLDYLLMDLPPGTGDVALSIAQMIPRAEFVLVSTPQQASARVAARAANMLKKTNQRLIGVIENMAYFICPNCSTEHEIFGRGGGETLSKELSAPLLGRLPLNTAVREGGDAGEPIVVVGPDSQVGQVFRDIARKVVELCPVQPVSKFTPLPVLKLS